VFELRPLNADGDRLGLCIENLCQCGSDVGFRHRAGLILILRNLECPLECHNRAIEQRLQRIRRAQIVIGGRKQGLGGELGIGEIGGGGLGAGHVAFDRAADLAP
jgi:hypothetical protein